VSDRYTKTVLTIIAAALVAIVIQNTGGSLRAATNGLQKVQICDDADNCASLYQTRGAAWRLAVTTDSR
jgi:hypothetical protein